MMSPPEKMQFGNSKPLPHGYSQPRRGQKEQIKKQHTEHVECIQRIEALKKSVCNNCSSKIVKKESIPLNNC